MASINWTAEGERWFSEIYAYIMRENPAAAVKVVEAIYSKVDLLKTFPYLGSRYDPESESCCMDIIGLRISSNPISTLIFWVFFILH